MASTPPISLTVQWLSCAARARVPKPTRRTACLHVRLKRRFTRPFVQGATAVVDHVGPLAGGGRGKRATDEIMVGLTEQAVRPLNVLARKRDRQPGVAGTPVAATSAQQ